jgi:hypothetical protein
MATGTLLQLIAQRRKGAKKIENLNLPCPPPQDSIEISLLGETFVFLGAFASLRGKYFSWVIPHAEEHLYGWQIRQDGLGRLLRRVLAQ